MIDLSRTLSLSGRRQRVAGERIAELFEQHGRMVYGVCRLILRGPQDAEDAAQQTFLSAYRGMLAGQEPREPSAWLGTIARNECRSRLRGRRTEPLTLVTDDAPSEDVHQAAGRRAEVEALCAALAELPPPQRDAIVLREFYGLSYSEVAAALGVSGSTVESLLFRSRRRLQDQLRPAREALGMLTLPLTLRDSLAGVLPGFGGAAAGVGAGGAVLAKVGSVPIAAKIAAATLALGTAGTVAGVELRTPRHRGLVPAGAAAAPGQADTTEQRAAPARELASLVPAKRPTVFAGSEQEHAATGRNDRPESSSPSDDHTGGDSENNARQTETPDQQKSEPERESQRPAEQPEQSGHERSAGPTGDSSPDDSESSGGGSGDGSGD